MSIFYCYARVSTQSQDQISPDTQAERLKKDAERLGMESVVIKEVGSGESMFGRPKFMKMLSDLKEGDVVGVWDQSRLSRSDEESFIIINRITEAKAKLMVNSKFLDINDPQDRAIFGINSVFASYSRRLQLQKSREGVKQKYANGDAIFTGSMIGWKLNKYGKASIVDEEAKVIRYIFSEFIKGKSLKSLEKELYGKVLSRPYKFNIENLRDMIMRPIYAGSYLTEPKMSKHIGRYTESELKEKLVKSNIYPPIISEDEWWESFRRYRNVRSPHAVDYQNRWSPHTLAGLYKCPCGKGISYHHRIREGKKFETYMFQSHTPSCPYGKHISYPMEWLEDVTKACFILTFLSGNEVGMFFDEKKKEIEKLTEDVDGELKEIEKNISKENSKKERLVEAVANGLLDNDSISKQMSKITDNLNELEHRKDKLLQGKSMRLADYETFTEVSAQDVLDTYSSHFREYILQYAGHRSELQTDRSLMLRFMNGKEYHILYPKRTNKRSFPSQIDVSFRGEYQFSFVYHKGQIVKMISDNEYLTPTLERWKKLINGELSETSGIVLGL